MLVQTIRIFAVAAVLWAARRLNVRGSPGFRTKRPQERRGVRRTRPDFHVDRLHQSAALAVPVFLQAQDDFLKGNHVDLLRRLNARRGKLKGKSARTMPKTK